MTAPVDLTLQKQLADALLETVALDYDARLQGRMGRKVASATDNAANVAATAIRQVIHRSLAALDPADRDAVKIALAPLLGLSLGQLLLGQPDRIIVACVTGHVQLMCATMGREPTDPGLSPVSSTPKPSYLRLVQ